MQIIYDGRKVQVWEFVFQGLYIGKWSTGKHCDGVAVVKKKRETRYVSKRWHISFKHFIHVEVRRDSFAAGHDVDVGNTCNPCEVPSISGHPVHQCAQIRIVPLAYSTPLSFVWTDARRCCFQHSHGRRKRGGGDGRTRPRSRKISGGRYPRNHNISGYFFLDTFANFALFNIFEIKWLKSEEKINYGDRWV